MTSMRLYVVRAGIGRRYRYSRSAWLACLLLRVCAACVRSAADQKQTRTKRDVSAGVRTALPQKHHPYPSCPSAIVGLPQESATFRQRRRTQCRTWPLGPSQVLDSLSLSAPTLMDAKPVGEPGWCCIWPSGTAPHTTARLLKSMRQWSSQSNNRRSCASWRLPLCPLPPPLVPPWLLAPPG